MRNQVQKYKSLWDIPDYRRLFGAQVVSLAGTGISSICLSLLAWEMAGGEASIVLSTVFVLKMLTYIILAPLFGAVAHRIPRKKTLIYLDVFRALLLCLLPLVNEVWQVYGLVLAIFSCSAGFTPLYQASLPDIVKEREHYTKALSFSRIAFDLEQIISPAATGVLLTFVGFRLLFILDAVTFLISAVLILACSLITVSVSPKYDSMSTSLHGNGAFLASLENPLGAIKNYLTNTRLLPLWVAYLSVASASAMVLVNTVVYVRQVLGGGDTETAWVMFTVGVGSVWIAYRLPDGLKKKPVRTFHLRGMGLIICALALGASIPGWAGYLLACIALGAGMSMIQTTAGLIINSESNPDNKASNFAAHFSLTHFWWLICYFVAGQSAYHFGLSVSFQIMLALSLISCAVYVYLESRN